MPEPLPPDEFAMMMAARASRCRMRQVGGLRHAHAKLRAMLELPRAPAPKLPAEPGFTFSTER